jgi:hypothetical protein
LVLFGSREVLMKYLTIATVMALIALLPEYSHALASKHHHKERGAGSSAGQLVVVSNAGPDAPVKVPEPGSFVLLATGLTTVGGYLARKWYVTKKRGSGWSDMSRKA